MTNQSDRETTISELTFDFIESARRYRFLYVRAAHENPLVQKAQNESIQQAHATAQVELRALIKLGMTEDLGREAWRLLVPHGVSDVSHAQSEGLLKSWAKETSNSKPATGAVEQVSRIELERRGKALLRKEPMTIRQLSDALGIPRTTAERLDCWKDRLTKNHGGRKSRIRPMEPEKLETVGATVKLAKQKAIELDRLVDEQTADEKSRRVI